MSTRDAVDHVLADFRRELHTTFPAKVLAYNVTAQTVDVEPAVKREAPSDAVDTPFETEEMPILYAVPVQWPRANGGALTFPIAVGDWVEISCAEQSLLVWRQTGGTGVSPGLHDPHGLNGAVARPGWYPDTEALTGVSATDVELRSPTGGVLVLGGQVGAQLVSLDPLVRAAISAAVAAAVTGHTHIVAGITAGAASVTSAVGVMPTPPTILSTASTKVKAL